MKKTKEQKYLPANNVICDWIPNNPKEIRDEFHKRHKDGRKSTFEFIDKSLFQNLEKEAITLLKKNNYIEQNMSYSFENKDSLEASCDN